MSNEVREETGEADRRLTTGSGKAETAVDVSRILQDILNTSISAEIVQINLKSTGFKSVVKSQCPLLSA